MFELRTLGTIELVDGHGKPVSALLSQPRRLALLAYLAAARPHGFHSRDRLLALFWPEQTEEHARHALRQALYTIRMALGSGSLLSRGDGTVALAQELINCDVRSFSSAAHVGRLHEAVSLYQGDFLSGFHISGLPEWERWLDSERDELRQRAAEATWSLAQQTEQSGDLEGAVRLGKRALALYPTDEVAFRRLLRLMQRGGNLSGALREYDAFSSALSRDYGLEPSSETKALYSDLCNGKGALQTSPRTSQPPAIPSPVISTDDIALTVGNLTSGRSDESDHALSAAPQSGTSPVNLSVAEGPRGRRGWRNSVLFAAAVLGALLLLPAVPWRASDSRSPNESFTPLSQQLLRADEIYHEAVNPRLLRSDSGAKQRLSLLKEAVRLAPAHAASRAQLANSIVRSYGGLGGRPTDMSFAEAVPWAEAEARMAIALDSTLAEAHQALGYVLLSTYRFREAERSLLRARSLDPLNTYASGHLVHLYLLTGREREALSEARRMIALAPNSPMATAELARSLAVNGRCHEALELLRPLFGLQPPLLRVAPIAAQCHAALGDNARAVDVIQSAHERGPYASALLVKFLAGADRWSEALALRDTIVANAVASPGSAYAAALAFAGVGDLTNAFSWLDRAVSDYSLTYVIAEPAYTDLRADVRFVQVAARLGRP